MVQRSLYHYLGITRELSYAIEAVFMAQAHLSGLTELPKSDQSGRELACVRLALGRLKGAFSALTEREQALGTDVALAERDSMATIPNLEKLAGGTSLPKLSDG